MEIISGAVGAKPPKFFSKNLLLNNKIKLKNLKIYTKFAVLQISLETDRGSTEGARALTGGGGNCPSPIALL